MKLDRSEDDSVPNQRTRVQICLVSRMIICVAGGVSLGSLWLMPSGLLENLIDTLIRTYFMFAGTAMAHEGVHGHLGRSRRANVFWARLAMLPCTVPYTNFRKTHLLHHSYTNIEGMDPDYFMKSRTKLEIVVRAIALPHQWFFWLLRKGRIRKADLIELGVNYAVIIAVYVWIGYEVGPYRLFWGMIPSLTLLSILLWYPFAIKTHEGYSTGRAELRSHNYYGRFMYWFSLGLSMHRDHHLNPRLSWLELRDRVKQNPEASRRWFQILARDRVDP
jgi:beta-carotene hydroxylase